MADEALQLDPELLKILRCPVAVQNQEEGEDRGHLEVVRDGHWLYSPDSGYKYPIREGIPVMLIEVVKKWKDTPIEDLPVPPPSE